LECIASKQFWDLVFGVSGLFVFGFGFWSELVRSDFPSR